MDEIKELTDVKSQTNLAYYFIGDTTGERFDDFNNDIKLFKKIESGKMNLKGAKSYRMCLNQILTTHQ